jgi:hypothetical protein
VKNNCKNFSKAKEEGNKSFTVKNRLDLKTFPKPNIYFFFHCEKSPNRVKIVTTFVLLFSKPVFSHFKELKLVFPIVKSCLDLNLALSVPQTAPFET